MNKTHQKAIQQFETYKQQALQELLGYEKRLCYEDKSHSISEVIRVIEKSISELIFSTSTGVYIYIPTQKKLLKILSGKYYGLTKWKDWWIATRSNNKGYRDHLENHRISDLIQFKLNATYKITEWRNIIFGIPGEIHQIDVRDDILYLPHTDFNQLLYLDLNLLNSEKLPISPRNALLKSIEITSNLSSHINSIFITSQNNYLIAHNFTMYTKKLSELIILDKNLAQKTIQLHAHSAHNIIKIAKDLFYCDSNNKQLYKNKEAIFEGSKLLRGLSITDNKIYVGGSDICFEHRLRYSSNPSIYILKRSDYSLIHEVEFRNLGDLYEIRQLKDLDYSLSIYS